jgi:predicted phage terminase large subunit-like protein
VAFFENQALLMDDVSYRCLYKNEPIEREGLLYHKEDLRTYLELPMREPDAILGVCDTKNKGTDFLVFPVLYQYDADYYLVDAICDDSADYGVQYENLANKIIEHNMQQAEFESNNGGDRVAYEVEKLVRERGGRCNITSKPTETNKETRIIVNADWVKKNIIFKDESLYTAKSDYGVFMRWLMSYSVAGKNAHDDVPDCMSLVALYITRQMGAKVTVTSRFF